MNNAEHSPESCKACRRARTDLAVHVRMACACGGEVRLTGLVYGVGQRIPTVFEARCLGCGKYYHVAGLHPLSLAADDLYRAHAGAKT